MRSTAVIPMRVFNSVATFESNILNVKSSKTRRVNGEKNVDQVKMLFCLPQGKILFFPTKLVIKKKLLKQAKSHCCLYLMTFLFYFFGERTIEFFWS